jgi:hypothetical protein
MLKYEAFSRKTQLALTIKRSVYWDKMLLAFLFIVIRTLFSVDNISLNRAFVVGTALRR